MADWDESRDRDEPLPEVTPTSKTDQTRLLRVGCGFLIVMVLLLWLFIYLFWTHGCTVNPLAP